MSRTSIYYIISLTNIFKYSNYLRGYNTLTNYKVTIKLKSFRMKEQNKNLNLAKWIWKWII